MTRVGFEPTPLSRHGDSCIPSGSGGPEPCALDQLGHLANLDGRSEQFWIYEGIPSLCCSILYLSITVHIYEYTSMLSGLSIDFQTYIVDMSISPIIGQGAMKQSNCIERTQVASNVNHSIYSILIMEHLQNL
jgi:hypothetical protein